MAPDRPMTSLFVPLALVLVMVAILLAAGYDSSSGKDAVSGPPQQYATIAPVTGTASFQACGNSLESFRKAIHEMAETGVDTSAAEGKYHEAEMLVASQHSLPAPQNNLGINKSRDAEGKIQDGCLLLDKASAERDVASAQMPIDNIDGLIEYFSQNNVRNSDPDIRAIIAKREIAVGYLFQANDAIASGNYTLARIYARNAYDKESESYNDALIKVPHVKISKVFPPHQIIMKRFGVLDSLSTHTTHT
jgi:hypothetical protein